MAMTTLERIKAAVAAHRPEDGLVSWYVDEFCIDCDAEEFWHVVEKALTPPDPARLWSSLPPMLYPDQH